MTPPSLTHRHCRQPTSSFSRGRAWRCQTLRANIADDRALRPRDAQAVRGFQNARAPTTKSPRPGI
eukprot:7413181-Lingulodinium_polyedra.AAC.1